MEKERKREDKERDEEKKWRKEIGSRRAEKIEVGGIGNGKFSISSSFLSFIFIIMKYVVSLSYIYLRRQY